MMAMEMQLCLHHAQYTVDLKKKMCDKKTFYFLLTQILFNLLLLIVLILIQSMRLCIRPPPVLSFVIADRQFILGKIGTIV